MNLLHHLQGKCCGWNGKEDWGLLDSLPCSCFDVNTTYESYDLEICHECYSNVSNSNITCAVYKQVFLDAAFTTQYIMCVFFLNNTTFIFSVAQGCSENIQKWLDENILFILVVILAIAAVEVGQYKSSTQFW